jgi:glutamate synthase (NADPH/NADH) small chain
MNYNLPKKRFEDRIEDGKPTLAEMLALKEADRCLYCADAACTTACPTTIDVPKFIKQIASKNYVGAGKTILDQNILGASCSKACPVEVLCVGACVYNKTDEKPIAIGKLQQFALEKTRQWELKNNKKVLSPKAQGDRKVALVGSGPASIACAGYLALNGVQATIYEKDPIPGGLNVNGIAPYKMKSDFAIEELDWVLSHGVSLKTGVEIGKDITIADLQDKHDAVFLGLGLGQDRMINMPGMELENVYPATELIRELKIGDNLQLPKGTKNAIVIGGGNTAIDIARELLVGGVSEVSLVYRRSEKDMSGYKHELAAGRLEGLRLLENLSPKSIVKSSSGQLELTCSNQSKEDEKLGTDMVVFAIGQNKQTTILNSIAGLELTDDGCVKVDQQTYETTVAQLYAGGDCINGGKEVVNAVAHGRDAAYAMLKNWL